MTTLKKRGKWSTEEDALILESLKKGHDSQTILQRLIDNDPQNRSRELSTLERRINHIQAQHNLKQSVDETQDLRLLFRSKEYYQTLKLQFTDPELEYFEALWVSLMQQFREDILESEEMQLKQFITVDILISRGMIERKQHIEEGDKLQKEIALEYDKGDGFRDDTLLAMLEQQLAQIRNSVSSYTSEYTKLLDQQKSISKDLKANRDARIKRIEDSKSSWASMIRALEDEELRERMGDDMELMKLAKDKVKDRLSQWHTYEDGKVDQPFLTPDTVKGEDDEDRTD